jgi:hypothetical protein
MKWSKDAIAAYKASGDILRAAGSKPMRDIADKDCNSILTLWLTPKGLAVTQVFVDTGDVVYMVATPDIESWLNR